MYLYSIYNITKCILLKLSYKFNVYITYAWDFQTVHFRDLCINDDDLNVTVILLESNTYAAVLFAIFVTNIIWFGVELIKAARMYYRLVHTISLLRFYMQIGEWVKGDTQDYRTVVIRTQNHYFLTVPSKRNIIWNTVHTVNIIYRQLQVYAYW